MHLQALIENCDVTLRQSGDASADVAARDESATYKRIFAAAFRSKAAANPSALALDYTSTPKRSHQQQQQQQPQQKQQQRKEPLFAGVGGAAGESKERGQVGVLATFDPRLKTVALLFGFLIIGYKSVILAMPYISADSVQEWSHQMQNRWNATVDWSSGHQLGAKLLPLLCGLLVAAFGYGIVYLDSAVPGVNPPSPFSPRSKKRYRDERSAALHLNYLCALFCGLLVTVFMYMGLWSS